MSYTPDDQLLQDPLEKAASSLEDLTAPMRERLKHPEEWNQEHLDELVVLLDEVTRLSLKMRILASQVR